MVESRVTKVLASVGALALVLSTSACFSHGVHGEAHPESSAASKGQYPTGNGTNPGFVKEPPSGGEANPKLAQFYRQKIKWGSCESMVPPSKVDYDPADVQCGTITVPVDYAKPDGPKITLALDRTLARGTKKGSIVFNPGGPGGSGIQFLAGSAHDMLDMPLSEHFDLVSFDPRGIGASKPPLKCETPAQKDADRARVDLSTDPAGVERAEARAKKFAQECQRNMGDNFLQHIGTADVAKDLDVIRAVLGDAKLNYVGYSYGTFLGTSYAEQFPDKVRAMDLDGVVDPAADPVSDAVNQTRGFETALRDFGADCAKKLKDKCPLGSNPAPAAIDKAYRKLVGPLEKAPARTKDPRGLSYNDAITGTIQAMYSKSLWKDLVKALDELEHGRGDTMLRLADHYLDRAPDGSYGNMSDVFTAVRCVDGPPQTREQVNQTDIESRKAAPFQDDGHGSGHGSLDACAFWPVGYTSKPHTVNIPNLPTIVVVSTTHDPATPYQAGVNLAKALKARLITYDGTQHTVSLSGIKCIDDPITAYFNDLTLPKEGLTC